MTSNLAVLENQLEQKVAPVPEEARALIINNPAAYASAADKLKIIKSLRREIDETFDGPIKAAYDAHKQIVAAKKKHEAPLTEAEGIIKGKMVEWRAEEERKRVEAERKAQEEARRFAEDQQLREAEALEKSGHKEAAEEAISRPIVAPTVIMGSSVPKVSGVSIQKRWKAEVVDLKALVKAIAVGTVPIQAIEANMVFLNQQARSLNEALSYPGVVVRQESGIAAR